MILAAHTASNIACERNEAVRTFLFDSRFIPEVVKTIIDDGRTTTKLKTALLGVPCNALQNASIEHLSKLI